jgi:hypothetical protein
MDIATRHAAARMENVVPIHCDLPMQSDRGRARRWGSARVADKSQNSQFQGCRPPTAQSLPVSPHWELGISRRQLENKITTFQ